MSSPVVGSPEWAEEIAKMARREIVEPGDALDILAAAIRARFGGEAEWNPKEE